MPPVNAKSLKFLRRLAKNWLSLLRMPDLLEIDDADFEAQMRGLVSEAERALTDRPTTAAPRSAAHAEDAPAAAVPGEIPAAEQVARPVASLPEMLRPLVQGVQAIGRA